MFKHKLLFAAPLFTAMVLSTSAHATTYEVRNCGKKAIGTADCGTCVAQQDVEAEFLVDMASKAVTQKLVLKTKNKSSESAVTTYNNCRIFDKSNWDCSEEKSYQYPAVVETYQHTNKMSNGTYIGQTVRCMTLSGTARINCEVAFESSCYVKKGIFGF